MHLESRDPVEVTRVPCDNLITQGQCRGRDEEIGRRNPPAARAQPGIDLGEHARNREGAGEDWARPEYGLNEAPRGSLVSTVCRHASTRETALRHS